MKKTLLLGLLTLAGFSASAQLANGTIAPDFTATDINGNTHTLSEYLAAGKTVIMDVSATWCGPCWSFHNTHALADLYTSHGPWGSDEVVVLFIEGDPTTTVNDIHGIASQPGATLGDWTQGSPFPIIDSAEIGDLYNIAYFPTVYRICPDGIVTELQPQTPSQFTTSINNGCADVQVEGLESHAKVTADGVRMCETGGEAVASAKIKNYGGGNLTSATVVIKEDGNVVATKEYTGNLARYATATVNFDATEFNEDGNYTVEITSANNNTPHSWFLRETAMSATVATETVNNVQVRVFTDNYPSEISWEIISGAGEVVATGGPYQPGNDDQWGGGGPDANTTKVHDIVLPEGVDCYTVKLKDSFNDGWSLGSTQHGLEIRSLSAGESVFSLLVGNFGSSIERGAAFKTTGALNSPSIEKANFAIYPNPSNGIFNFMTTETVDVTIMDLTGKTVHTAKGINDGGSLNLSALQKGMYIAKINGANAERIEKLIIK